MGVMDNYKYNKSQATSGSAKKRGGGVEDTPVPQLTRTEENQRGRGYRSDRIPEGPLLPTALQQYHNATKTVPAWLTSKPAWLTDMQAESQKNARIYVPPSMTQPKDVNAWRDKMQQNVDQNGNIYQAPATVRDATGAGGSVMDNYLYSRRTGGSALTPTVPTGSFLAANGRAALNGDQSASWLDLPQFPTGTFFGAGGEAVRGPDASYLLYGNKKNGGYGGYGGGGWGGGGGGGWNSGGGWGGYDPKMGLYSWNFKG